MNNDYDKIIKQCLEGIAGMEEGEIEKLLTYV